MKAKRIHEEKRVAKKRAKLYKEVISSSELSPRTRGKFKHHHFGCGCGWCKPWKHFSVGESQSLKFSDYKRSQAKPKK